MKSFYERPAHPLPDAFSPGTVPVWDSRDAEYFNGKKNGCFLFRRTFDLPGSIQGGNWKVFADTRYRAYLDGTLIGWGPSRCDHRLAQFDVYPLDLERGRHVFAIFALHYGYSTGANTSLHQMLIAEANGVDESGCPWHLGTDRFWKSRPASWLGRTALRVSGTLGPMEISDERERIEGWMESEFDDTDWTAVVPLYPSTENMPWFSFEARDIPRPVSRIVSTTAVSAIGRFTGNAPADDRLGLSLPEVEWREEVKSLPVATGGPAVLNLSWPEVLCGFLQLEIEGSAGCVVDVYYAEHLDGRRLAAFAPDLRRVCDRFILRDGTNRLEVQFGWKAFAHVQIWIDGPAEVRVAAVRTMEYPLPADPSIAVGEPVADGLIQNCFRTLRLCAQDGLLDSPSREQQQWMGDGERQASALFTLYRETRLWRRLLNQIGQSIDWNGCLLPRYPGRHEHTAPIPAFMLSWIFSHEEYARRTGDESLLEKWWPHMVAVMRWFTRFTREDGLLADVPHWTFIDWGETPGGPALDVSRRGMVTPLNALYLGARRCMAACALRVGDDEGALRYHSGLTVLQERLRDAAWDSNRRAFVDCVVHDRQSSVVSEPTNLLMLAHANLPDVTYREVLESVFLSPKHPVVHMSPFFHQTFGRVLARAGQTRFAFDTLVARLTPSWDSGATTIWERNELFYRPVGSPEAFIGSASHAWGAMLPSFLIEEVLGLRGGNTGSDSYSIAPDWDEFPRAAVGFWTDSGMALIAWQTTKDGTRLNYAVPPNAIVHLRELSRRLVGNGTLEFAASFTPNVS